MAMPVVEGAIRNLKKVNEHIDEGMEDIINVMATVGEDQDMFDMENVSALEKVMLDYASMERTLKQFTTAVNQVKSQLQDSATEFEDVGGVLQATINELASKNTDEELQRHIRVQEFKNRLQEIQHAESEEMDDEAGPSSFADRSLGEEDLIMTQEEVGTKCPFSQQEMTNPVKNQFCGHHYDAKSIRELLKKRKKIRCPLPGCGNPKPIQEEHLESDAEFMKLVEKQRRANKRKHANTFMQ